MTIKPIDGALCWPGEMRYMRECNACYRQFGAPDKQRICFECHQSTPPPSGIERARELLARIYEIKRRQEVETAPLLRELHGITVPIGNEIVLRVIKARAAISQQDPATRHNLPGEFKSSGRD